MLEPTKCLVIPQKIILKKPPASAQNPCLKQRPNVTNLIQTPHNKPIQILIAFRTLSYTLSVNESSDLSSFHSISSIAYFFPLSVIYFVIIGDAPGIPSMAENNVIMPSVHMELRTVWSHARLVLDNMYMCIHERGL